MTPLDDVRFAVMAVTTLNDTVSHASVVEVACVKVHGLRTRERFHALLKPTEPLPEEFTRRTGIDAADVAGCPSLESVLPELARFIDRDIVVWTHAPRRSNALYRHFHLTQPREKEFFLDALAGKILPDLPRCSLSALAAHFEGDQTIPSRAEPMARTAAGILIRLLESARSVHGVETAVDLLALCPAPKKVARRNRKNLPFDSDRLRRYPTLPGVYFMKNRQGEILYIGKAGNLRGRLRSYFQDQSRLSPKIAAMMKQVTAIDTETVGSELEALLLEARLIKLHQPFFNRKIKDYKGMLFMEISLHKPYPDIAAAEEADTPGSLYFGPFTGKRGLQHRMDILNRIFRLRSCTDATFREHRTTPCMQFDMGLCSGPCAGKISRQAYRESVEDFIRYLQGRPSHAVETLSARREAYSEALMFEKAGRIQEQLTLLEQLQLRNAGFIKAVEEHHCILVLPHLEPDAFRLLAVLRGQPYAWRTFNPRLHSRDELAALVDEIVAQSRAVRQQGGVIPKDLFEEARLISRWLATHSPEEGSVVYLHDKSGDRVLDELLLHMDTGAASLCDDDWEREWASG